jgi:hypothetical protein
VRKGVEEKGGGEGGREGRRTLDNDEVAFGEGSKQVPGRAGGTDGVVPREGRREGKRVGGKQGGREGGGREGGRTYRP